MVSTVGSSTSATATAAFNGRHVDRCQDGTLWATVATGSATLARLGFQYSKDNGATWTASGNLQAGAQVVFPGNSSLFIDLDDYAHVVWKAAGGETTSGTNQGSTYYSRGTPNAGRTAWTWSAAQQITASSEYDFPDVVAHRQGTGWSAHVVLSILFTSTAGNNDGRVGYKRFSISSAGAITDGGGGSGGTGMLSETFQLSATGNINAGYNYPSIDFNHTGDGKTVAGGTPHLYVGWTAGTTGAGKGVRFRKAVYSAGAWTWNAEVEIDSTRYPGNTGGWLTTLFDGSRVVMAGTVSGSGVDNVTLYERDAADTTTTTRILLGTATTTATTTELLGYGSATYDSAGNVYLLGRDYSGANGAHLLNRRKWTRAGATLGPIVTFDTTGSDNPYIAARRGYAPGSSIDYVWTKGTASPYSVQFDRLALAGATPYTPVLML